MESGEDVTCVCSYPIYPSWKPSRTDKNIEGVKAIRGGLWVRYPRSLLLRRAVLEIWFAVFSLWTVYRMRNDTELLISQIPPSCFALLISIFKPKKIPHVVIVSDLQYVFLDKKTGFLASLIRRLVKVVERGIFQRSDKNVFLSNAMLKFAVKNLSANSARSVIQYPFKTIQLGTEYSGQVQKIMSADYINVVYSGAIGEKQAPDVLLELFINLVQMRDDVRCYIFSQGAIFDAMQEALPFNLQEHIIFRPLVPAECLEELYRLSDFQIVPQLSGTSEGAMPSKIPNLMATSTNIFAFSDADGELDTALKNYPLGFCSNSNNPHDIAQELDDFISKLDQLRLVGEDKAAEIADFVNDKFDRGKFVSTLLAVR